MTYRPVEVHSVLGRVLTAALLPICLIGPRKRGESSGRWRAAAGEAASLVTRSWGQDPAPEDRLGRRGLLHASCIVAFIALALPGALVFGLGSVASVVVLEWLGALAIAAGAPFIALDLALAVRQLGANFDFQEWDRSGRPEERQFRAWSQPRPQDLGAAAVLGVGLVWFFLVLSLG